MTSDAWYLRQLSLKNFRIARRSVLNIDFQGTLVRIVMDSAWVRDQNQTAPQCGSRRPIVI